MSESVTGSPGYEPVLDLLAERTGLVFPAHRRPSAERVIAEAMDLAGVTDAARYRARLEIREADFDELVSSLTVGETYFFREPAQFEFLRGVILPELVRLRAPDHVFRVWSAACASGEEAYSLAILFELAGLERRSQVLATDISRSSLAKARAACYRPWSLRGDGADEVRPYLENAGPGRFRVVHRIRERVAFEYLNLALDGYPALLNGTVGLDVILCRNVLLYFDAETIRAVAERLHATLADGGWLLVAATDPPLPDDVPFERTVTDAGVFYRRPPLVLETAAAVEVSRSRPRPANRRDVALPADSLSAASRALELGRYDEAVREAEACGDDAGAAAIRVRALAGLDAERALCAAADAVTRHPLAVELHYLRAVLLLGAGRIRDALPAARRVLFLDRGLATGHFLLGTILERSGDPDRARRCYRTAARLCGELPAGHALDLGEGETAGRLAAAAAAQIAILEAPGETA